MSGEKCLTPPQKLCVLGVVIQLWGVVIQLCPVMGCTYSDMPSDSGDGFTFRVYNVDSQGIKLNPGKIKVAASHLVLFQKGKEDIRWPLRCLRRYGFDEELFSFECGRRCQTGSGIYAFKCHHAEDLFNTVQDSIHRAGEEEQLRAVSNGGSGSSGGSHAMFTHTAPSAHPTTHPLTFSQPLLQQHSFSMAGGSSPGNTLQMRLMMNRNSSPPDHQYMNGAVPSDSPPQYINTDLRSGAFPIEESSPLIDFMNHPGQRSGGGGAGGGGNRAQVNYAVILPSSMENLLDEEGQDAVTNFPPPRGPPEDDFSRHSLPPDLASCLAADSLGGLHPDDIPLQAGDSDVFLPDSADDTAAFRNYINIRAEPSPPIICCHEAESVTDGAGDAYKGAKEGGGGLTVEPAASFMAPYANLVIHGSGAGAHTYVGLKPKPQPHTSHYLELDLNPALSECAGASGGAVPSQSPTSPISSVSMPEATSSYAKIDFNKTEALSHSSRAGTNGEDEPGARKTRHNSTIGM
ncbi:hypothetical protein ACOMHN_064826 [Nucella lapillus]